MARALGGGRPDTTRTGARADSARATVDAADEPVELDRWYRFLVWPAIGAVVTAAGLIAAGVPAWRGVVIGLSVGAALWAVIVSLTIEQPEWPYDVPTDVHRAPTSWEVPGLVGAQESEVSFQHYFRPRLWELAQELLRRRGIDPLSERAAALVGPREYAMLTGADTDPGRTTASVSVLCQTIARLAVEPAPGSEPAIRNPALAGLAGRPRRSSTIPTSEGPHR
jgi:hypothetical protein